MAIVDPNRLNIFLTPPKYAVWLNSLRVLSLLISITCALLATLLPQLARRYLKVTQPRYSPLKRAGVRALFFEGTTCLRSAAVEAGEHARTPMSRIVPRRAGSQQSMAKWTLRSCEKT